MCAVIDIRMPPTFTDEGLRLALELRSAHEGLGILLFSQYVETRYAADLLADDAAGIGYLLKDRVADVSDFVEALERVAVGRHRARPRGGDTAHRRDPPHRLALRPDRPRARGARRSWPKDAPTRPSPRALVVTEGAVEKHVANIFSKLDLPVSENDHRRVLAVLRFLES